MRKENDMKSRSMARKILAACLLATLVLLVVGCVKMERPAVEKHYYNLAAGPGEALSRAFDGAVSVRRARVSPRYEGRDLVYRTTDTQFTADFYNSYFVAPADLITQEVRERVKASGLFAHVLDPSSLAKAPYALETAVTELYGDFSQAVPKAVLKVQFFLLKEGAGGQDIVFSREYARAVDLADRSARGLVDGQNAALASVLDELARDLGGVQIGK
jgi:cholesterol transport system auxiliary component